MIKIKKRIIKQKISSFSFSSRKRMKIQLKKYIESLSDYTHSNNKGLIIDDLISKIDLVTVDIHDVLRHNVFTDIDYYKIIPFVPLWIRNAGNSAECITDKKEFEQKCSNNNNYLTNKLLYYHDLELLLSSFQDRYITIGPIVDELYKIITPNLEIDIKNFDNVTLFQNTSTYKAYSYLNSIFIYLGSSFDLLTKIAYELKHINTINFNSYPKLKCRNILFGQRSKVDDYLKNGTIFSYPPIVRKIQSIRDEIIHNGSFDFQPDIYVGTKLGKKDECWIYFPDFNNDGILVSSINRNKFYSQPESKFNNILPDILIEILSLILSTLNKIKTLYDKPYYKNDNDLNKYKTEIDDWHS